MSEKNTKNRIERGPVVAIMGHIDHGKSTLLDYIRESNITGSEAGGITQHLSAYEAEHAGKKITFLDTPGHEAFSQMRSRGADVADIAILIVSAEDAVKAQTIEALSSIKEAKVPYIVAINKIDKPSADIEKTKNSLLENEVYLEGLGGDIPWAPISAKTGEGVPELLDLLLLAAELEELEGDPNINAKGIVIESHIDTKKGISSTLIIKDGTLKSGMFVVIGDCLAPVRIMEDFQGKPIKEAVFPAPVRIIGFNNIPQIGSSFTSYENKKDAEKAVKEYSDFMQDIEDEKESSVSQAESDKPNIPIIIKADVLGTLDAIEHEISKIDTERVDIKIIQKGAGAITENDIKAAGGKEHTIVIGFNVKVDRRAQDIAERAGIEIQTFTIIYELSDWLAAAVKNRTPKMNIEEVTGQVKVLKTFSQTKDKQVLGGRVESGVISVDEKVNILRKGVKVGEGKILNLQKQKAQTKKVEAGNEFGSQIKSNIDIVAGDILESFVVEFK